MQRRIKSRSLDECFGPYVQIVSRKISRWFLLDGRFLFGRKLGFKLSDDLLRQFAFDRKYVGDFAIVMFRPKDALSVLASINWALTRTRSPERWTVPSNICATPSALAISRRLRLTLFLYCITDVRLITFRSATLGQISENLVLHAISEVSILFLITQIFEREHGDTLFRYCNRRS